MIIDKNITHKASINSFNTLERYFNKVHNNKYNYEDTIYKGSQEEITVLCYEHGPFSLPSFRHKRGTGCPNCRGKGTIIFKEEASKIHTSLSFDNVVYINSHTDVEVSCPIHGIFYNKPSSILNGVGCRDCTKLTSRKNKFNSSRNKNYIIECEEKHKNFYDYSLTIYINAREKVKIICPIHGIFEQYPTLHRDGCGCHKCNVAKRTLSNEEFISKSKEKHKNLFDYGECNYTGSKDNVKLYCKIHKEIFKINANAHLNGGGCQKCSNEVNNFLSESYRGKSTILYLIKIKDVYKIGVTRETIKRRYREDIKKGMEFEIVVQYIFKDGFFASEIEKEVLKGTREFLIPNHKNSNIIPTNRGSSELRSVDIASSILESKYINKGEVI